MKNLWLGLSLGSAIVAINYLVHNSIGYGYHFVSIALISLVLYYCERDRRD